MQKKSQQQQVVVGLGKSGLSLVRFLAQQGQSFTVADSRVAPPGLSTLQQEFPEVEVHCGPLSADLLSAAQTLYVSPGLALSTPAIATAMRQGVAVSGDIDLFAQYARAPIVAITGSNAKSTVTTLVGAMFTAAGLNVAIGGNLGIPALELLDDAVDVYVMELSSFQLETTSHLKAHVAVCLNISEDHMDRYEGLDGYIAAKQRIFTGAQSVVINRDDPASHPQIVTEDVISFGLSEPTVGAFGLRESDGELHLAYGHELLLPVSDLKIRGSHNYANALAALALGTSMALPMSAMLAALRNFPGLAHRCQWVRQVNEVDWYNDSKATNVGAALAAIEGLGADHLGKLILIAGGDGKGAEFKSLVAPVTQYCRAVIVLGQDGERIAQALSAVTLIERVSTIGEAVQQAALLAQPGDSVLLAPACASLDMFKNFEERGEQFVQAVERLL
ncbi:UDP-N-acetylmuramoyl-L-alanine--D-glutamate ligase [Denitrificimonas sp. JX-1]|uniref:UDP-N-acetylmuramoylalanine--D-glutamate ligase n=1 Tax=Denitrificimonas halotolerans TaxID=3098930 RepID=A0ABU5GTC6_9GAMM|nr:UDP-N-acetylmuramoyl-L-alanine--D-glutamate ligase [Denitrificimonas sp. JX-1]MDY7220251.1 UDP-N-acetylmuramoyl-L-alanine--D-glutamate ligase [Denitrificimonas sp. JX-1]